MKNNEYLLAVKTYLTQHYSSEVVSIILFGSLVDTQENPSNSTDVDLLIIIKDTCSIPTFNNIYRELLGIEALFLPRKENLLDLFR